MNPLQTLYQKIVGFESKLSPITQQKLKCKKGCSQCCYTTISVFEVEAKNIREWFAQLSEPKKLELKRKWSEPLTQNACVFLNQESCTIYEARPLICRTQGQAIQFRENQQDFLDICPLNESMLETIEQSEILNLDLLNQILTQIEMQDSDKKSRVRVSLAQLRQELLK